MVLIGTLENVRLREGDRVTVLLGSGEYEAEVIDAGDLAKLKVKFLDTGRELWIGRRCIVDLVNEG